MNVIAHCQKQNWRSVAFIGCTKHAGKTTALNAAIVEATALGLMLGLCSIGVDGERLDAIMGVEKPSIYAPAGTLVVSAERALEQSEATLEWLEELPIHSPLGTVMLARVRHPGTVMLAGVRQRQHVEQAIQALRRHGVEMCLVDGAFDRVAAASPHVVDAAVLAVGAVAARTVEDMARYAIPYIWRFQLPVVSETLRLAFMEAVELRRGAARIGDSTRLMSSHQAAFGFTSQDGWSAAVTAVYLPGALSDGIVAQLLHHPMPLDIVVNHPAQVLLDASSVQALTRAAHRVSVWTLLPLAAIAANPHSMTGFDVGGSELRAAIRRMAPNVLVYDALASGEVGC